MKHIVEKPLLGTIVCFVLFIFAVFIGQINAQDTINTIKTVIPQVEPTIIESPWSLSITWMAFTGWLLGFLFHTSLKINKIRAKNNFEKFKKFFRINLFRFIGSLISAMILFLLVVAFIDTVNSSGISFEKLPKFLKDYGNFAIAVACVFIGIGNSSLMLWLFKTGKSRAGLDYQDDKELSELTNSKNLTSGLK